MTEGDGGSQVLVISCHLNDFFHIYFRFGKHMNKILKKKNGCHQGFHVFFRLFMVFSSPKVHPNDPRQGARTWAVLILSDAMAPAMKCHLDILSQARTRNNWNWGRL